MTKLETMAVVGYAAAEGKRQKGKPRRGSWILARERMQPLDATTAEALLREAKQIMDRLGIVFFLRHGTCLGAVRDRAFTPWDDDLDLGTVLGLHGLTEDSISPAAAAFRDQGYFAKVDSNDHYVVSMMKSSVRVDWSCYKIIDDSIFQYPGVRFPVGLFTELKEIDFIGEGFLTPNPPEEYLRRKYGADWMRPRQAEYEKDILAASRRCLHTAPVEGPAVAGSRLGREPP